MPFIKLLILFISIIVFIPPTTGSFIQDQLDEELNNPLEDEAKSTFDDPKVASEKCPNKCECERTIHSNQKVSIAVYCFRGGLNDSDFYLILQNLPLKTTTLEIRAPPNQPNRFQWNDNLNRLNNLQKLILVNCGIPALSQAIRLPSLRHLDLGWNRVDQIQMGSFIGLPALESLDISHNRIQSLPTGAFIYSKNLARLSLSHNNITDLAASLLRGPQRLIELELDGNRLKARQLNALFGDVEFLERLEINECNLTDSEVMELNFAKVPNVLRLGLGRNNLTKIPSAALRAMPTLNTVDLSHNFIKSIGPCTFCSCNISRVFLAHNLLGLSVNPIDPEAFAETKITELDLSFNFFEQFDSAVLSHQAQRTLKILHLSGNQMYGFHERLIHTLPRLTHLHMAYNQIQQIPYSFPKHYAYLKFMNLSGNQLDDLPSNMAELLPNLQMLDLSHNQFSSFSHIVLRTFIEPLDQVYLHHNPWDCECAVQSLQHYMLQRLNYRSKLNYEQTQCAQPKLLKNQPLYRVQKINDCAVLFGSTYGLTQASELLILLAALLVAAFLVSVIVIIFLYCGREQKQKSVYVTREHSRTQLTQPPLDIVSAGGSTGPSSLNEPLTSASTLLLSSNGISSQMSHEIRRNPQRSPPPPGSMFVTF